VVRAAYHVNGFSEETVATVNEIEYFIVGPVFF
jgi:hypothetical protein